MEGVVVPETPFLAVQFLRFEVCRRSYQDPQTGQYTRLSPLFSLDGGHGSPVFSAP